MKKSVLWLATVVGIATSSVFAAGALEGEIVSYECGDNCYLTVKDKAGTEHTALCTAALCDDWNAKAAMPASFIGKKVRIQVGEGKQVDGEGNVMGTMDSFDEMTLVEGKSKVKPPAPTPVAATTNSHCSPDETTLFSCELSKGKLVSLCASHDLSPKAGYLQYRFGKPGNVELALPKQPQGIPKDLALTHSKDASAEYNAVSFMNGEYYSYELTSFRQFKAKSKDGNDTPPSSDTLMVRDQRKSMREGDVVFNADCRTLGDAVDAVKISGMTGVKWERAGF